MKKSSTYLFASIALVVLYAVLSCYIAPALYSDAGWGFQAWNSFLNGNGFNQLQVVNLENIAENDTNFLTHWTPGQYFFSGVFAWAFSLPLGVGIILSNVLAAIIGLYAFSKLFLALGFEKRVVGISLLIIATAKFTSLPFSNYNGAEILMFAYLPMVFLLVLRQNSFSFKFLLLIAALHLFGFFLKSSYLLYALALTFYLFVKWFRGYQLNWNLQKIYLACSFLLPYILIKQFYIGNGSNPSELSNFHPEWLDVLYPLAGVLMSALSLDDLLNRIFFFPSGSFQWTLPLEWLYLPLALISAVTVIAVLRDRSRSAYQLLFGSVTAMVVVVFIMLYFFDAEVSKEARHFRMLGLLLIPALVHWALHASQQWRKIFWTALLGISVVYGLASFTQRKWQLKKSAPKGGHHILQPLMTEGSLKLLNTIDANNHNRNGLIYIPSPEIALEIKNLRTLIQHADFLSLEQLQSNQFKGKVDSLYLLLPSTFDENGKRKAIQNAFVDYQQFDLLYKDEKLMMLKAHH